MELLGSRGMYTGEVLRSVKALTKDRLSYFVRAGYVTPKRVEVDHSCLYNFSEEE